MYSDFKANFDKLLEKDSSFSIHHRNVQTLAIETFKFLNWLSPPIINEVSEAPNYLRDKNELYSRNPYRTESVSFLASKIGSIVPQEIKKCKSLDSFKKWIKK